MLRIITLGLIAASLTVAAPASAGIAQDTQAHLRASQKCWAVSCDTLVRTRTYRIPGATAYGYSLYWNGYGLRCHYGPQEPTVVVADSGGVTDYYFTPGNTICL